jgi:hypothetical protein
MSTKTQVRQQPVKHQGNHQGSTQGIPQSIPQGRPQGKPRRPRDGFDDELVNKHVRMIVVGNGSPGDVSGTIIEASRYWYKILDDSGSVRYINKAFIVQVVPG